ncbi:class I adenylate-forming enzyme family protein [Nocardia sp. NPDC101769]|uniref:class I adenylate-forming enzyme family protein n=1 Tax=Nocardia sp. NPDC101769 TaxID=3364333 RepID=UPI0038047BC0
MNARNRIRGALAADAALGIGNALTTVFTAGVGLDDPLITFDTDVDGHQAWQPMTLRVLHERVAARAAWLSGAGVAPRELIGIYAGSGPDTILNILALLRIGAIPAPVNSNVEGPVAADYFVKAQPAAILADTDRRTRLGADLRRLPRLLDAAATGTGDPATAPPQFVYDPADAAVVTHSSGTTGAPKAVLASHASLFASVRHRLRLPRAEGMDRILSALPVNHAAIIILLNLALCNGQELMVLSSQSGNAVLEAIARWRPSAVLGFAPTWPELTSADLTAHDLGSVQIWWNTGDCAHETHIRKLVAVGHRRTVGRDGIRTVTGSSFIDGFGSTEMGHSQFFITHTANTDRYRRCIGRRHAFADVAVLDEMGEPLPAGIVGQLGVKSPTLSIGYWNDHPRTARTRLRGYFLTGDLVYRDEDGYFYHVDRASDAVDLGGEWLYTALCEERLLTACPDAHDCTIVGLRRPDGGVSTTVFLELTATADRTADRTPQVLAALPPHVAATVTDVVVDHGEDIPHGPTGKVRKAQLRSAARLPQNAPAEGLVFR